MSTYKKSYYELNRLKLTERMRKYYYNNKIEFALYKKKRYEENRENEIKQAKEYYKENKNKVLEYKFHYYSKNNYDLSNEIIDILYGIKENNKIKKLRNINYYITIAEMYNIEIN